jgi:hypothetical protein
MDKINNITIIAFILSATNIKGAWLFSCLNPKVSPEQTLPSESPTGQRARIQISREPSSPELGAKRVLGWCKTQKKIGDCNLLVWAFSIGNSKFANWHKPLERLKDISKQKVDIEQVSPSWLDGVAFTNNDLGGETLEGSLFKRYSDTKQIVEGKFDMSDKGFYAVWQKFGMLLYTEKNRFKEVDDRINEDKYTWAKSFTESVIAKLHANQKITAEEKDSIFKLIHKNRAEILKYTYSRGKNPQNFLRISYINNHCNHLVINFNYYTGETKFNAYLLNKNESIHVEDTPAIAP